MTIQHRKLTSIPVTEESSSKESSAGSRARWSEVAIEGLIRVAGVSTIFIVGLIFFFLLREGIPAFLDIPLRQLFGSRWYPIEGMFGLWPLIFGSILVTAGAIIIAVPLGLTTAIYLGEIAPPWQREILKPLIEVLAGIPSIVLGFLGWVALAPIIQRLGATTGLTAFTGALILAYMSLPTIISISEDALYAVPKEYRDGALAIGATQWQTIWRVVLPAARSGIVIAIMLGIGRAHRRNDGGDDGYGQCGQRAGSGSRYALSAGPHHDRHHCRRNGRGGSGQFALQRAIWDWHCALCYHFRH